MGISSELIMPIKRQQETMSHSKILWEWGKECPDTKLCSWETVWNLIDGSLYRNGFFKVHPIASLPVHGELALLNVTSSRLPHNKPNYCTFNSLSLLISWKRTMNLRNQRLGRHIASDYTLIMSRTLKVTNNNVMYDRGAWFLWVIMSSSRALCCLLICIFLHV